MLRRMIGLTVEAVHMASVVASPILVLAMFAGALLSRGEVVLVKLEGLCCERISRPAVKELRDLPGVYSVQTDVRSKTMAISLRATRHSVLSDAWRTLERHDLRPAYMVASDLPIQR